MWFIAMNVHGQISNKKDIPYRDITSKGFDAERNILDVYFPSDLTSKKDVFVFIHGGSWNSGKKDTYRFLARKMAKKGFVTVLVNYTLSPQADYNGMAVDCAYALDWIAKNIEQYGGDPSRITLSGHSAGAHLAGLIAYSDFFQKLNLKNPISKLILIDAFGLDMHTYFQEYHNDYAKSLRKVFSDDPAIWKKASPVSYISRDIKIPTYVLAGSKTYKTIRESSADFYQQLQHNAVPARYDVIKGRKHTGMIIQLLCSHNKMYKKMITFIKESPAY